MDLIGAIQSRRSIRSFEKTPVPKPVLEELLEVCRWTPSSSNTQPWEFAIVGGDLVEEIKGKYVEKLKEGWDSNSLSMKNANPDLPEPNFTEPYLRRIKEIRKRRDRYQFPPGTPDLQAKRDEYLMSAVRFYDAPNLIILFTDRSIYPKALIDIGLIAQTLCLAALHHGLGTCLMTMAVLWPEVLREVLHIPDSKLIVLGIAIGYPDLSARVNGFERVREPVEAFTHWHGY
ncbi:MAG: nitroreductase [Deltaproteobacteria bacterium]|nr:nitroreductase [Deltaproteobacteria bacterium]